MTFDGRDPACQTPADRVRACLCEAGYPSVRVADQGVDPDGRPLVAVEHSDVPPAVMYQAFVVSRVLRRCWDHWWSGPPAPENCEACANWTPPRELLLAD